MSLRLILPSTSRASMGLLKGKVVGLSDCSLVEGRDLDAYSWLEKAPAIQSSAVADRTRATIGLLLDCRVAVLNWLCSLSFVD